MALRSAPTLQSGRNFFVSSDNGTTTPLPIPYQDFWDINSVPNFTLTQVYEITDMTEYQGRVIYINKTQNTLGGTIRLQLPGGYTFSSTGTQTFDFPDDPTTLIISISTSPVVAVQVGSPGNGTPILSNTSFRACVDPTSNPDPTTNGLVVPTGAPEFQLPLLITDPGLGIAKPYIDDSNADYSIEADYFVINNAGRFCVAFTLIILGYIDQTLPIIAQILRRGQTINTAPPITGDFTMALNDVTAYPPFARAWVLNGSANCDLDPGEELILAILPNNSSKDIVIQLPSNISVTRIDSDAYQGPAGSPGGYNINYQVPNSVIGGMNIYEIESGDRTSGVSCSPNITQVQANGLIQLNSGTGTVEVTNLPLAATGNVLYYNTVTKAVTYAPPPSSITSLTGDVVAIGPGAAATTISNSAVTVNKIANNAVSLNKLATVSGNTLLGNTTGGIANVQQFAVSTNSIVGRPTAGNLNGGIVIGTGLTMNTELTVSTRVHRRIINTYNPLTVNAGASGNFNNANAGSIAGGNIPTTPGETLLFTWWFSTPGSANITLNFGTSVLLPGTISGKLDLYLCLLNITVPATTLFAYSICNGNQIATGTVTLDLASFPIATSISVASATNNVTNYAVNASKL